MMPALVAPSPVMSGLQPRPRCGDDAAGAGREIVDAGIARGDERGVFVDDESDAGAESERAGDEDVILAAGAKDDAFEVEEPAVGTPAWTDAQWSIAS